jgi:hypothetical protein
MRCAIALVSVLVSVAFPARALDVAKYVVAEEIIGVVVEADTGKPLPGAVVALRFKRSNTGHAGEHCFRSMAVETDAEGRFRFAPWKLENTRANATLGDVTVYKQGYAEPVPQGQVRQESRSFAGIAFSDTIRIPKTELQLAVAPFVGSDEERMTQLRRVVANFTCRWQAQSEDQILAVRVRDEIAASPLAEQKPRGGGYTPLQWIDSIIKRDGAQR